MIAAAPQKFTFDLDLGGRRERSATVPDSVLSTQLAKARNEGFEQGRTEGERTDATKAALRIGAAAEQLAAHAASMTAALDDRTQQHLREAIDLSASVGRKLAGNALALLPTAEIEALIADCLASIGTAPHLVIRCAPDLADAIRDIAVARMEISGFAGRLVVMGDPEQHTGDCRIEWVDGGLVRERSVIEAEIDRRITSFLTAKGIGMPQGAAAEENTP